jgi:predicted Zn finger-like uncharacterized protein
MLIQCPFCHATAKLSDEKEGARVRCGGCSKVFVAREKGARVAPQSGPSPVQIGIGVGLLVALAGVGLFINRSRSKPAPQASAPPAKQTAPPPKADDGWDAPPVVAVRELYAAAAAANPGRVATLLHEEKLFERLRASGSSGLPDVPFNQLSAKERADMERMVADELSGSGEAALASWHPFDGKVTRQEERSATVELEVSSRAEGQAIESRRMRFELVKPGERWEAWAWERVLNPAEQNKPGGLAAKGVTKVTTKEGGFIYQAEMRDLPHLEDTPPELRARIDQAVVDLVDYQLTPKQNNAARAQLVEIGKPAIPILLTKIHQTAITDDDSLAKVTNLYKTLVDITGYDPGFSALGTGPESEQARTTTLKAYFAWWIRKGEEKFEKKVEGKDLLEEMIPLTERDKREIEADRAKAEAQAQAAKAKQKDGG